MYTKDGALWARDLLLGALNGLYAESPGLVGFDADERLEGRALRANERAVAARLAVHIDRALCAATSPLTVDVEYSRVLMGVMIKKGRLGQIFPDLIVHHRGEPDQNLLAVEIKPRVPKDPTRVDTSDDQKMQHLTSAGWMGGQSAYVRGVCLQLAHNRARLHWYEGGVRVTAEEWAPTS